MRFSLPLPESTEYVGEGRRSDSGLSYDAESHTVGWTGDVAAGDDAGIAFRVWLRSGVSQGDGIAFAPARVSYEDGDAEVALAAASPAAPTEISVPGCLPGDVNADGEIGLEDVIASLQALAGQEADEDICPDADTDEDERIGTADAVFVLQKIAE